MEKSTELIMEQLDPQTQQHDLKEFIKPFQTPECKIFFKRISETKVSLKFNEQKYAFNFYNLNFSHHIRHKPITTHFHFDIDQKYIHKYLLFKVTEEKLRSIF